MKYKGNLQETPGKNVFPDRRDSIGGKDPFSPLSPSDWIVVCMVSGAALAIFQLCREGQGKLRVPSCKLALELPKGKKKKKKLLSHVQFFATPWLVALQAPLSIEFSR